MNRTIFTIIFLAVFSVFVVAEEPYVLCVAPTHELLATFDMSNSSNIWVEAELPLETNRVEITQVISNITTAWYGPNWEGLHSYMSDEDGYCWWTCPEFNEDGKVITNIDSSSGVNNHIGLIIPKGKYRFSFERSAAEGSYFVIENLTSTNLPATKVTSKTTKMIVNGQLVMLSNGIMYNILGAEMK